MIRVLEGTGIYQQVCWTCMFERSDYLIFFVGLFVYLKIDLDNNSVRSDDAEGSDVGDSQFHVFGAVLSFTKLLALSQSI